MKRILLLIICLTVSTIFLACTPSTVENETAQESDVIETEDQEYEEIILDDEEIIDEIPSDSSDGESSDQLNQSSQTEYTDEEIINVMYSDYKVPDDFFIDVLESSELISDSVYYERILRNDKWLFYCTSDFNTAKQLVEENIATYNLRGLPKRFIVEISDNEKFFEFKTIENKTHLPDREYFLRYRVYKCTYLSDLQHGMYYKKDATVSDSYIGLFSHKPITVESVKELVEFLWYSAFSKSSIKGSKVLDSYTQEQENSIKHTLIETGLVGGDWGLCDEITLTKSVYTISKDSGEIHLNQDVVRTIKGRCN